MTVISVYNIIVKYLTKPFIRPFSAFGISLQYEFCEAYVMKEIQLYTHLIYNISGMINRLKMKDIQMENGVKLNSAAMSMQIGRAHV